MVATEVFIAADVIILYLNLRKPGHEQQVKRIHTSVHHASDVQLTIDGWGLESISCTVHMLVGIAFMFIHPSYKPSKLIWRWYQNKLSDKKDAS